MNFKELKEKLNVNQGNFNQEMLQNDRLLNSLNIDSNSFFVVAKIMFSKTLEVHNYIIMITIIYKIEYI